MAEAKKKSGRRSIDPKVKEDALKALSSGETLKAVSEKFHVSIPTLSNWKGGSKSKSTRRKGGPNDDIELLRLENMYLKAKLKHYEDK